MQRPSKSKSGNAGFAVGPPAVGTVSERNLPIRSEGEEAGKSHGPAAGFQETDFKRSRPRRPWDPLSLTEREKQKTAAFGFEEAYRRLKRNKSRLLVSFFFFFFINDESARVHFNSVYNGPDTDAA